MATFQAHGYTYATVKDLVTDQLVFNPAKGVSMYSIQATTASANNLTEEFLCEYSGTLDTSSQDIDLPF